MRAVHWHSILATELDINHASKLGLDVLGRHVLGQVADEHTLLVKRGGVDGGALLADTRGTGGGGGTVTAEQ